MIACPSRERGTRSRTLRHLKNHLLPQALVVVAALHGVEEARREWVEVVTRAVLPTHLRCCVRHMAEALDGCHDLARQKSPDHPKANVAGVQFDSNYVKSFPLLMATQSRSSLFPPKPVLPSVKPKAFDFDLVYSSSVSAGKDCFLLLDVDSHHD